MSIRRNGAPMHACFMPCRLLSSVLGGYLILGEREKGAAGYVGLVLVGTTMAVFLWSRMRKADAVMGAVRAEAAEAVEAGGEEVAPAEDGALR